MRRGPGCPASDASLSRGLRALSCWASGPRPSPGPHCAGVAQSSHEFQCTRQDARDHPVDETQVRGGQRGTPVPFAGATLPAPHLFTSLGVPWRSHCMGVGSDSLARGLPLPTLSLLEGPGVAESSTSDHMPAPGHAALPTSQGSSWATPTDTDVDIEGAPLTPPLRKFQGLRSFVPEAGGRDQIRVTYMTVLFVQLLL